jgi:hypothetical protein
MDNHRFNVTGDNQAQLVGILEFIFRREFRWPQVHAKKSEGYGGFTGYRIDPHLGLVLYQYPIDHNDKLTQRFPFGEGYDPQKLAAFVYNYLNSEAADKVTPPPLPETRDGLTATYDAYACLRHDYGWDGWCDHDGSNNRGWRIYTGDWGHIPMHGHSAPFAIRPITAWYGK